MSSRQSASAPPQSAVSDSPSRSRLRLPLPSADPPGEDRNAEVRDCFAQLLELLGRGEKIYIHCSAGLHRTGMVTHAFLRWLGHSRAEALALMRELREATADAATEPRLAWGDQFAPG